MALHQARFGLDGGSSQSHLVLSCCPLWGFLLAFVLWSLFLLGWSLPVWSVPLPPERTPLTLELLQERLRSPTQSDGIRTVDLRRLVIDLRPENATFRDQFYRLLHSQFQRSAAPLGLDLSYSLIQGDFQGNQLGLRTPLYGATLPPIFTPAEQVQLQRDRRRLSQLSQLSRTLLLAPSAAATQAAPLQITVFRGPVKLIQTQFTGFTNFSNTFFLHRVEAQGAGFNQSADWSETRFSQSVTFAGTVFNQSVRFRNSLFIDRARFSQMQVQGGSVFQGSEFQSIASFNQSLFQQPANFSRIQWQGNVDLSQTRWQAPVLFTRDKFTQSLFLTDATFEQPVLFREAQFNRPVNLRGASILEQADFSNAGFAKAAYLNVPGLKFDPDHAKLLGNSGQIGSVFSVPSLQGNENLLRNLVRNFRLLEQIPDANQVEYTIERLRLRRLVQQLLGTNINAATAPQLINIGFSPAQAASIIQQRLGETAEKARLFRSLPELLSLENIDLSTYLRVRDRAIAGDPLSPLSWLLTALHWLGLSLLLLLSRYGTSFWLIFGVGLVAIAYFSLLFWLVDRVRRWHPRPIVPQLSETISFLVSFSSLSIAGMTAIFRTAEQPWLTLSCLALVMVPVPALLLSILYWRGRYHNLMDTSYFVEDGSLRQLRLLIGRLPTIPRFPLFRERYLPLLWERRWNWLNYYDFSLNNLLKLGFNDIRLRDEHLPGLITSLVWYQWCLGILYIALLLWTLSRTIPGLNLLIYFK